MGFNVPIAPSTTFEKEHSTYFWYPGRFGVRRAPHHFRTRLREIHPDLDCTWHPVRERWLVWYRKPSIRHHACPGWMLLMVVEDSAGQYVPLDERVFAAVFLQSAMKWGRAKDYFTRVEAQHQREQAIKDKDHDQARDDRVGDLYDYHQIKNIGHGSKFEKHHS